MEYILDKFRKYLDGCPQKQMTHSINSIKAEFKKERSIRKVISMYRNAWQEGGIMDMCFLLVFLYDAKADLIEKHQIFVDYDILSKYLTEFPSSDKERMLILMESIKNNIESIKDSEISMNRNSKQGITFYNGPELSNFFARIWTKVVMRKRRKARKDNLDKMISYIKIIQERYLEKITSFNEEDIKIITETLKNMKVNDQMCNEINELLSKEYRRRIKNQNKEVVSQESIKYIKQESKTVVENNSLSKKEYHEKIVEASKYFDLKQMKSFRYITPPEKVELIRLLKELNYENIDIEKMLKIIDTGNKIYHEETHPMIKYMNVIDKIIYYREKLSLSEQQLQDLKYNFGILLMCDDSEYIEWKNELATTLKSLENMLPKTHEYELEQAEKASILVKR